MSRGARVCVRLVFIAEFARRERAVRPVRLVDNRNMRLDAVLLDQPSEHRARAIRGVRDQTLGIEPEAIHGPVDHGPGRTGLGGADGPARLHIDDDPMVGVDEKDRFAETILLLEQAKKAGPWRAAVHWLAGSE